jgi:ABC-type uncharacterized transport system substrate-binding protein
MDLLVKLTAEQKLPAVYYDRTFVAAGGLVSYGTDVLEQYRLAAGYVDRILKDERPTDLPVQAPSKYETFINLNAAKALNLEIHSRCSPVRIRSSNKRTDARLWPIADVRPGRYDVRYSVKSGHCYSRYRGS